VADGGMDDEVVPFSPLEDEDGADVAVDEFHRPLQGDVEQIVGFEGHVAQIRQLLEGGDLRYLLVQGDKLPVQLRFQRLKGRDDILDFIGGVLFTGAGGLGALTFHRDGSSDSFGQGGDVVEDVPDDGEGKKGKNEDGEDEDADILIVEDLIAEDEEKEAGERHEEEESKDNGELVVQALALHGEIPENLFYVHGLACLSWSIISTLPCFLEKIGRYVNEIMKISAIMSPISGLTLPRWPPAGTSRRRPP